MRLIETSSLHIEEFFGHNIPEYVILSHTWGKEEVTLQDVETGTASQKKGYRKIQKCCEQAVKDGFSWAWIDTCCIDKTSSSELSEAINSMYQWYQRSCICYVHLEDFSSSPISIVSNRDRFAQCRWWRRGWTLQELLAPTVVEFYDKSWTEIGTKVSLHEQITKITGVDGGILRGDRLSTRNVALRMSWAANRKTSRIEDRAYSLLGVFGVNMPLLYGEGERAFARLQEEIMRVTEDYTLFVWCLSDPSFHSSEVALAQSTSSLANPTHPPTGLLAESPRAFRDVGKQWLTGKFSQPFWTKPWGCADLTVDFFMQFPAPKDHEAPFTTSRGICVNLPMIPKKNKDEFYACVALIHIPEELYRLIVCIELRRLTTHHEQYCRQNAAQFTLFKSTDRKDFKYRRVHVPRWPLLEKAPLLDQTDVSLLIVQPTSNYMYRMQCLLCSWVNLPDLVSIEPTTEESNRSRPLTTIPGGTSKQADTVQAIRISEITHALSMLKFSRGLSRSSRAEKSQLPSLALDDDDIFSLVMNNSPDSCFFTDISESMDRPGGSVRGIVGFVDERYPNAAFMVLLTLFSDRAACKLVPCTIDNLRGIGLGNRHLQMPNEQEWSLIRDRLVSQLDLQGPDEETCTKSIEVSVRIRRIATSSIGVRRFVLSIDQRTIRDEKTGKKDQSPEIWSIDDEMSLAESYDEQYLDEDIAGTNDAVYQV